MDIGDAPAVRSAGVLAVGVRSVELQGIGAGGSDDYGVGGVGSEHGAGGRREDERACREAVRGGQRGVERVGKASGVDRVHGGGGIVALGVLGNDLDAG